jgi:outer membrane protein, heavy metal efflux system
VVLEERSVAKRPLPGYSRILEFARAMTVSRLCPILLAAAATTSVFGQAEPFSWQQIVQKFEATNPILKADRLNIDESRAAEITAYLRPNPDFTATADGFQVSSSNGIFRPLGGVVVTPGISYLHEREHKRELRRDQAKENTAIAETTYLDQRRGLLFNLQSAFANVLQAKAVLRNATENLNYWDRELGIFRERLKAGDLAEVDMDRLDLQRVQFESDFETAFGNLRTAKVQILMLLNDRTPIERFDVTGKFDFNEELKPLEEYRQVALEARPDLKVAVQNVELAKVTYALAVSNGSTDPTFSAWYSFNPSFSNPYANQTVGGSITVPLRIFDRNQGEKARTQVDIGRNEKMRDAAEAQVLNDVDTAYWNLVQNVNLLKPYKARYLELATRVRQRVSFAFQNGGASLLDYLDAEKAYRDTRLAYLNLVGNYLGAVAQMDMAAGREVIQ